MSFQRAVEQTPHLHHLWRQGLRALRGQDRQHIEPEDPRRLRGSVNVDAALQLHDPNAHRWDYAIGYRHTNRTSDFVYWVEIHTASTGQINVVLKKREWLKRWLAGPGNQLSAFDSRIIWVASGPYLIAPHSPQSKRLAEFGLRPVSTLHIPNVR